MPSMLKIRKVLQKNHNFLSSRFHYNKSANGSSFAAPPPAAVMGLLATPPGDLKSATNGWPPKPPPTLVDAAKGEPLKAAAAACLSPMLLLLLKNKSWPVKGFCCTILLLVVVVEVFIPLAGDIRPNAPDVLKLFWPLPARLVMPGIPFPYKFGVGVVKRLLAAIPHPFAGAGVKLSPLRSLAAEEVAVNPLLGDELEGKKELADVDDWSEGRDGEGVSMAELEEVGLRALPGGKEENDWEGGS